MEASEIKNQIEAATRGFHEAFTLFKTANDKELALIKAGSQPSGEQKEFAAKLNTAMDAFGTRLEKIEASFNRPEVGSGGADVSEKTRAAARKAMNLYLRKGVTSPEARKAIAADYPEAWAEMDEVKAMSVGSDPDGGYLVRPEQSDKIQSKVFESSPVRQEAEVMTIGGTHFEMLYDNDEPGTENVSETGTRNTTTSNVLKMLRFTCFEMSAKPKLTQNIIDDAMIDVEAWHNGKVAAKFARDEATDFISGNGTSEAQGITSYTAGDGYGLVEQIVSGHATEITADGIISLQDSLFEEFQGNAKFMMARQTASVLRKLKDSTGQYLWNMNEGLDGVPKQTLRGNPVRFATDLAKPTSGVTFTASALPIIFGDFRRGYLIVERQGVRVLRDPYSAKPYVELYTTKRVGGGVQHFQALKLLKISA